MTEGTENRILDAAEQLFAGRGYGGTTTRALADEAGVNEVTIFRLFRNKLGVLRAVLERVGVEQMRQSAEAGELPPAADEALSDVARREIERTASHGVAVLRVAFEARTVPELAGLLGEGPAENLKTLAALFERWQAEDQVRSDIDPRILAEAFFSLTSSVVMYRHMLGLQPSGDMPLEEVARQLTEVFLDGALAKEQSSAASARSSQATIPLPKGVEP